MSRSLYYKSDELWERFKQVCKAGGKNVSLVLGEFIDNYIVGYIDPSIPPITTYMDPDPNSIGAVQRKITKIALKRANKLGPTGITLREIRTLYAEAIPSIETRNLAADRTAQTLREQGVKVWQ